jgi:hypothetical protein
MREPAQRTGRLAWRLLLAAPLLAGPAFARPVLAAELDQPDPARVATVIRDWPKPSQNAAQEMMRKYGPPQEATATLLIWQGNSPWKRTLVHKSPVEHDFPLKHMDVLEQVADYRVPLNLFSPLATFDGSVVANRTRGEVSASGDTEATNIMALNLADDIVQGKKTVEQARDAMGAAARDLAGGRTSQDAKELRLPPPQGDLADPDTAVVVAPGKGSP